MNPRVKPWLAALAAILLCHVPVWCLRPFSALPQPIFEVELLLAAALFARNRWLGGCAIVVAWTLSLIRGVALNYHFHDVAEFLDSMRFVDLLTMSNYATWGNGLLLVLALCGLVGILTLSARINADGRRLLVLASVVALADVANGSASAVGLGRDIPWTRANILGTPSYNVIRMELAYLQFGAQPLVTLTPAPSSYDALRRYAAEGEGSALLILVESLGWPQDEQVRDWLLAQVVTPTRRARWEVSLASEPFYGGTVGGEVRVLCGMRGHYSRLDSITSTACVPWAFAAHGVESVAMHGFSRRMFDRGAWWPVAGFRRTVFDDARENERISHCPGAFNGLCDHDVVTQAVAQSSTARRRFVYALTINTHLPLPRTAVEPDVAALCRAHEVPDAACQLLQAQATLLRDIGTQLAAAPDRLGLVAVVGDHSPPFVATADRQVFSPTQVPALLFTRASAR